MRGLKKYRKELEARGADLREAIRNRGEITIEQAPDEIDAIQLAELRDEAIRELDRESRLLREVTAALERIQDGSYGVCERCEEYISLKRLSAIPWARHCVQCQEAVDREVLAEAA